MEPKQVNILVDDTDDLRTEIYVNEKYYHTHGWRSSVACIKWLELIDKYFDAKIEVKILDENNEDRIVSLDEYWKL